MERAVIAEFPVVVEVPEPFLQNTHFGKAGKLAFWGALHFGTSFSDDSWPDGQGIGDRFQIGQ